MKSLRRAVLTACLVVLLSSGTPGIAPFRSVGGATLDRSGMPNAASEAHAVEGVRVVRPQATCVTASADPRTAATFGWVELARRAVTWFERHYRALLSAIWPTRVQEKQVSGDATFAATELVRRIQRADYEGDRDALRQLHADLARLPEVAETASRVRYWRGFALWRRAINGFNQPSDAADLGRDLEGAAAEFEQALRHDPSFVDAKAGLISCVGYTMFLHRDDASLMRDLVPRWAALAKEAQAAAPDNPRLLWVMGPSLWYVPPGSTPARIAERQAAAITTYERGLRLVRQEATGRARRDPLEPVWGEPELLMNLAWSHLNRERPDLDAARRFADAALALVPYWHYVRAILIPQIERAGREPRPAELARVAARKERREAHACRSWVN